MITRPLLDLTTGIINRPTTQLAICKFDPNLINYVQTRGAARKGKRIERARQARLRAAKRRATESADPKPKKNFKRNVKIDKEQLRFQSERDRDLTLAKPPADNVYFFEKFRKERYNIDEIIDFHRQTAHPDMFNQPNCLVMATVELNLKMKIKKKRYIDRIETTVFYPNIYTYQQRPRKIVALCKEEKDKDAALEAGAIQAGSTDVAALIKTNQLTHRDFDHLVCSNDFLNTFAAIKGMKAQPFFPNIQRGNYGDDIVKLVNDFKNGVDYSLRKLEQEPAFGWIDCHFGTLDMTNQQLKDNLLTLFNSINRFKPMNLADNKQFFERVLISTPVTNESFLLKFWELVDDYQDPDILREEEELAKSAAGGQ